MADNVNVKDASDATVVAATDQLSDSSQSPKVTLLAGDGSTTGISPATSGGQTTQTAAIASVETTLHADQVAMLAALSGTGSTPTRGWATAVALTLTTTNGAYSAGDAVGGLLTFTNCAEVADYPVIVTGITVTVKSAVLPIPTLVFFDSAPTTMADNAAYALTAADSLKERRSVPILAAGGALMDHGTPNSYEIDGLFIVLAPATGTRSILAYLIDTVGVTLTSTADVQVTLRVIGG